MLLAVPIIEGTSGKSASFFVRSKVPKRYTFGGRFELTAVDSDGSFLI